MDRKLSMRNRAFSGPGLRCASIPESSRPSGTHIAEGHLKQLLEDWCEPYTGYHLYYASRRQSSAAFALLVDALRYRS
jgi:hypothetical protein